MPLVEAEGRSLYAESFGLSDDPPLLLISGLTSQLTSWPVALCEAFVDRGFFVMRFDNRDVGLSTNFTGREPYTLSDMADDCVEVLDFFAASPAHILGASMGGMIAQTLAIDHPEVVASLTSLMSSTRPFEARDYSAEELEELVSLMLTEPQSRSEAEEAGVRGKEVWGTVDTWDAGEYATYCGDNFDRAPLNGGGDRQYAAIVASGDREDALARLDVPTLVLHGGADALIDPERGRHTADVIPNSTYVEIDDMNHDLPMTEWPQIVQLFTMHASQAGGA
ncbi:MAG: pimeloyl-ACP methyl ester carboxylesterase [Verrucomicrobiales bacterium]|jgi:pimeloyl-ACP methyl ester carboxylesterase